jgi:hypothetical protein
MKKVYYFVYISDDLAKDYPELNDLNSYSSGNSNGAFSDVYTFLDRQYFDVRKSVVQNLVEYAVRQSRSGY